MPSINDLSDARVASCGSTRASRTTVFMLYLWFNDVANQPPSAPARRAKAARQRRHSGRGSKSARISEVGRRRFGVPSVARRFEIAVEKQLAVGRRNRPASRTIGQLRIVNGRNQLGSDQHDQLGFVLGVADA